MNFESLVGHINQVQDVLQAQAAHAVNHSKISAIADSYSSLTRSSSGVNHSKISAIADR